MWTITAQQKTCLPSNTSPTFAASNHHQINFPKAALYKNAFSYSLSPAEKKLKFLNLAFKVMNSLVHLLVLSIFYICVMTHLYSATCYSPKYTLFFFTSTFFFSHPFPPPTEILPTHFKILYGLLTICNRQLE